MKGLGPIEHLKTALMSRFGMNPTVLLREEAEAARKFLVQKAVKSPVRDKLHELAEEEPKKT